MAEYALPGCGCLLGWCRGKPDCWLGTITLTPSADVPACRDEDPAHAAVLNACYPEDSDDA